MLFWSILLGISIVGVFALPIFRILKPRQNLEEDSLLRDHLQKKLGDAKNLAQEVAMTSSVEVGKGLSMVYNKGLSIIKKTRFSALIKGKGILKKKEVTSSFLRDVKEHRDKIREELTSNGNSGDVEKKTENDNLGR